MSTSGNFLTTYELEILWTGIFFSAFQLARNYLKQKANRDYIHLRAQNSISLPLKPKPNWIMIILSVVFGVLGVTMTIQDFANNNFDEALYTLGLSLSLLFGYILNTKNSLYIRAESNAVFINNTVYEAPQIKNVELWDDLIFFELSGKKEIKYWIRFKAENYKTALKVVTLIEKFCLDNDLPLDNNFAKNIEANEVFNPQGATTK